MIYTNNDDVYIDNDIDTNNLYMGFSSVFQMIVYHKKIRFGDQQNMIYDAYNTDIDLSN